MPDHFFDEFDPDYSQELDDLENQMKENFDKLSKSPNSLGSKMFQVLIDDVGEFKKLENSHKIMSILAECDTKDRQDMIECPEELREIYR